MSKILRNIDQAECGSMLVAVLRAGGTDIASIGSVLRQRPCRRVRLAGPSYCRGVIGSNPRRLSSRSSTGTRCLLSRGVDQQAGRARAVVFECVSLGFAVPDIFKRLRFVSPRWPRTIDERPALRETAGYICHRADSVRRWQCEDWNAARARERSTIRRPVPYPLRTCRSRRLFSESRYE
jgi:hypothetical protein